MLDGVSGVDLATVLMDREPVSAPPPPPAPWTPRKAPKAPDLLLDSVKEQVSHPLRLAKQVLESNGEALKLLGQVFSGFKPLVDVVSWGSHQNPPSTFRSAPPPVRDARAPACQAEGGARQAARDGERHPPRHGGRRAAELAHLAGRTARVRPARAGARQHADPEGAGTYGNQVSAVFCPLPLTEPDPVERLRKLHDAMMVVKKSEQRSARTRSRAWATSRRPSSSPRRRASKRSRGCSTWW